LSIIGVVIIVVERNLGINTTNNCKERSVIMYKSVVSQYYLLAVAIISAFRVMMYTVFPEAVARVKISKQGWEDEKIREVALSWTGTIHIFMTFRAAVAVASMALEESSGKFYICLINVGLDIYLFFRIVQNFVFGKEIGKKVVLHQDSSKPVAIQAIILLSGIAFIVLYLSAL
jgi:hypothetical protein